MSIQARLNDAAHLPYRLCVVTRGGVFQEEESKGAASGMDVPDGRQRTIEQEARKLSGQGRENVDPDEEEIREMFPGALDDETIHDLGAALRDRKSNSTSYSLSCANAGETISDQFATKHGTYTIRGTTASPLVATSASTGAVEKIAPGSREHKDLLELCKGVEGEGGDAARKRLLASMRARFVPVHQK